MKNRIIILSLCASCLLAIVAFVYNSETKTDPLALSPIVAKRVTTPTGTLVSCNLKALKDTVDIPLSYLTEELQVVKLDNRDEALVGGWIRTTVGEKYILVSNNKQTPYKLFTRDGKFITTIGAYGQGPNEYGNTYADQLDEAHNRIYILPWQSDKLLVFDLQGNPQPPIPLCMRVPKGKFRVDTEKSEVTLTTLPFEGWPAVVWTQDFKGKRKNFIAPGHLTVPRDFSNEVFMDNNTNDYGVMLMVIMPAPRTDSLYHYNAAQNRLEARFTVEYSNKEKIKQVIESVLAKDSRILSEPAAPFIALTALADSSVNVVVRVWVNSSDYWGVYFDINKNIYATFNEVGIGFPFPQLTVHQAKD